MRRIKSYILLVIVLIETIFVFDIVGYTRWQLSSNEEWEYHLYESGDAELFLYHGDERTNLIVPGEVDGHPVKTLATWIGDGEKHTFVSIELSEGLEEIKDGVFAYMPNLKLIMIPNTIKIIGYKAFYRCDSIEEIVFPDSVEKIEGWAIAECKKLKKATIMGGNISDYMFVGCRSLAEVNLGEGLKTIGERAFANCENLKEIKLPESLTTIGHDAFAYTGLENIIIPESVEYIENGAFKECENLKEVIFKNSNTIFEEVHGPTGKVTITNAPTFDNSNNIATVYAPITSQAEEFFSAKGIPVVPVVKVEVNGEEVKTDVPPILLEGRVLIPARAMFEALGAQIGWEENTRTVTAMTSEKNVAMQIDNPRMSVNGLTTELDVAPRILINRTLVPARAISESLGATVEWDEERQTVVVTY